MLAITGIFGMAAYSVSERMKEQGISNVLGRTTASGAAFNVGAAGASAALRLGLRCCFLVC
jgi:hypothetical protein